MAAQLTYRVVDGKALWNRRTLAEWVPEAVRKIAETFRPLRVILFGSVARGEETPDSDLDFLVVFDHIEGRRHDLAVDIDDALAEIGAPVDVLVVDKDDLDRRADVPGVLRVALREGRVLHERPS